MAYMLIMEEPLLSKWVMKRYLLLNHALSSKRKKEFTFKDVEDALQSLDDDSRIVALFLSELRKAGWLIDAGVSKKDARKRLYTLKTHDEIFNEYVADMLKNKGR
jgi:uncharacterized protein (DUF488 family)